MDVQTIYTIECWCTEREREGIELKGTPGIAQFFLDFVLLVKENDFQ